MLVLKFLGLADQVLLTAVSASVPTPANIDAATTPHIDGGSGPVASMVAEQDLEQLEETTLEVSVQNE